MQNLSNNVNADTFSIVEQYSFLFKLIDNFKKLGKFTIDGAVEINEVHLSGSRFSAKTFHAVLALVILCCNNDNVVVYLLRKMNNVTSELRDEVWNAIYLLGLEQKKDFKFKENNAKPIWEFANGSKINVRGVYMASKDRVPLKGLSTQREAKAIVRGYEEANEFNNAEKEAVTFATRGNKNTKYLTFDFCNPDSIYEDHIQYINDLVPFDEQSLKLKGYQYGVSVKNNIVAFNMYSNWRINRMNLAPDIQKELIKLERINPKKARVWSLGMPGSLAGSVFGDYDSYMSRKWLEQSWEGYFGGVDFGFSESPVGHPSFAVLTGYKNSFNNFGVMAEWAHSNATQQKKSPYQIAIDIVNFYYQESIKRPIMRKGTTIYYDYGGGGQPAGDMCKRLCAERGYTWLNFVPVDKSVYHVKDRVDIIIMLLCTQQLQIDKNTTPKLVESMLKMKYKDVKDKETYKPELVDLNDDGFDALCYSIMKHIKHAVRNEFKELWK